MVVAVQIIKLVQNRYEVVTLNIFKEQPWIFCTKWNNMLLLTSLNFGRSFKEIFKQVVVKKALWTREEKLSAGLRIFHEGNIFLHKSDLKT